MQLLKKWTKKDPVARAFELAIFTFVSTATGG
jgi:hypothetical protein